MLSIINKSDLNLMFEDFLEANQRYWIGFNDI